MVPSLTSLAIDAPSQPRLPGQSDRVRLLLSDLQPELHGLVLLALSMNDCVELQNLCRTNKQFADICRDAGFWVEVLRSKGWMPDWSAPHSPGGMAPKAYYVMICGLNDAHRSALLGLSLSTTTIRKSAFFECTSLALTELPPTLTTIEEYAFEGCTSLTLTQLPPNLIIIRTHAFQGCTSLALTQLPPTLTSIGEFAFFRCTSLTLTHLPHNLETIEAFAFYGCTSLVLTQLPPTLTTIEDSAFYGCTSLALTGLPPTITSIGFQAFDDCPQLRGGEFEQAVRAINQHGM